MSANNARVHQLTPFDVGQIKAHMEHGLPGAEIARRVKRADGRTCFGETAILNCMAKLEANPLWRGEKSDRSGRPRKTTTKQDKQVVRWLLKQRGKQRVTVSTLKKEFTFLRPLSDSLVEERFFEEELKYLRRRKKSIVTEQYLGERVTYCKGIKRKHQSTLERWACTDGTVFYLDRIDAAAEDSFVRSLGPYVWRKSDNKDAMKQECLGPSSYSKGQGAPVKVWGMLAFGVLRIYILDQGETMNQHIYAELVEDKFDEWAVGCDYLVCDYESCLRCDLALHALSNTGLQLLDPYPKCSQDFNAIENAWGDLGERLKVTQPRKLESRENFIKRLKDAVSWMNRCRKERLWYLSTNQKERAEECLKQTPPGGRTSW
jgi:hypothetical protein